ncbi:sigma-E factor negative regulatory protein [Pseudomonas sp. 5P_3.1_Bac2]|uniref:sigma-E factor negative regulatory protein n=1 Tax=Pseudomonas sp. 5P_3.1_Bac2 TaxID=2971617 RepID=UPI0021C5C8D5|nr:RseA family anti-sigma factor [Pseudomonas sp. 5P_3.1_Bac2]MCU1715924.1 RseA family anti-sigma factor [Pseudomonas sp. 5P_3.1_Bac2]
MSQQTLQESLSAVMDNQADELELRRVLAASEDPELRATWARYQTARAAMRKETLYPSFDISAAVSAAIADEPAPAVQAVKSGHWRLVSRLAVAASVTVAVLAGVRMYNQNDIAGVELAQQSVAPMSMPQTNRLAILAGFNTSDEVSESAAVPNDKDSSQWYEKRLPSYIRQHSQQAATGAGEGVLPYARAASLEDR